MTEGKRVSVKAVLLGVLSYWGCAVPSTIVIATVAAIVVVAKGVPAEELADYGVPLAAYISVLVLSLGASALGGYVAGRVAKGAEVLHGGIVGAIPAAIALVFVVVWPADPVWLQIVQLFGSVPFGMTGGFLARRGRERKRELSSSAFGRK